MKEQTQKNYIQLEKQALKLKQQGNQFFSNKQYQKAIQKYTQGINICPTISILYSNRSRCYRNIQRYQKVFHLYILSYQDAEMAIKYDDKNIKAYYLMGQSLVTLAQHSKDKSKIQLAIQKLKKSLTLCPSQGKQQFEQRFIMEIYRAKKKLWQINSQQQKTRKKALRSYLINLVQTDQSLQQESKDQYEQKIKNLLNANNDAQKGKILESLICPITKTIMMNPICNQYGNSYSKGAYLDHIKNNGKTDPLTKKPLQTPIIKPFNHFWRRIHGLLIKKYEIGVIIQLCQKVQLEIKYVFQKILFKSIIKYFHSISKIQQLFTDFYNLQKFLIQQRVYIYVGFKIIILIQIISEPNMQKIFKVGIRRQDKSVWQRRAPLSPCHVRQILQKNKDLQIVIQPSKKRVFSDYQYQQQGAIISQDISNCDLIVGIKQVPVDKFIPDTTFMFFSHTIKAQSHNMPALDKMLQLKIRLIDYQKITDDNNSRLIAFGKYAGIAGAIDFLKGFGQYIMQMGFSTPFLNANCSYKYFEIAEAYQHLKKIGKKIVQKSIPQQFRPMIFAITGRGRTAKGCLEVLQNLPITLIRPNQIETLCKDPHNPQHAKTIYVANINSEDVMVPLDDSLKFDKQDYYKNPSKYKCVFHEKYLPYISALYHCIYWDHHSPMYIQNRHLKQLAQQKRFRLIGICDVSCDLNGSIQCLKEYTQPERPFFYFDSLKQKQTFNNHYEYGKFVYLAIDFLPSQLAYDASMQFSHLLKDWIPDIVRSDSKLPLQQQNLIPALKRAIITLNGKLTPSYEYIEKLRQKNNPLLKTMLKKEQIIKTEVGETASILNKNVSIIPKQKIKPQVLSFTQQQEENEQQNKKKAL